MEFTFQNKEESVVKAIEMEQDIVIFKHSDSRARL